MKKVRYNTFETNSSSTHAIVVAKEMGEKRVQTSFERDYCFGRQECHLIYEVDEKIAYIYGILKSIYGEYHWNKSMGLDGGYYTYDEDIFKHFEKTTKRLCNEEKEVDYYMEEINGLFKYLNENRNSWKIDVDHSESFKDKNKEFIDRILYDEDFYARFLFSEDSYITVGGDEYRGYNIKTIGFEYDYEDEWVEDELQGEFWNKLEKYEETHDVYLKGN